MRNILYPFHLVLLLAAGLFVFPARCDDWPQWRGIGRDGVWKEEGILETFPGRELAPRWTAPVGAGYSGPTVAKGRVYLMDRREDPEGERVLCFDAKTGKPLWVHAYDCSYRKLGYPLGPRASVTVHGGQAFALGAMGHLHALDAASGEVLWVKDLDEAYGIQRIYWGVSPSPLVWNEKVIVPLGGSNGACVVALDQKTGRESWKAVEDRPAYSSPMIVERDGKKILLCWTERYLNALDPDTGKIFWQKACKLAEQGARMNVATPVLDGDLLFLCSQYEGASVYRFRGWDQEPKFLWQRGGPSDREAGINPPITTALFEKGYAYGPELDGEFRCLDAGTGDVVWASKAVTPPGRWSTVHIVKNGGRSWIFNEAGELIIAGLSPAGFQEVSRARLIDPTHEINRRNVCWAHPAFAERCVFARNDRELLCAYLGKD